jgi:hypothetical protein
VGEVLDATDVVTLVDRGFRGMAKAPQHSHAPVGDRRTKDQRTDAERAHNRCRAGLRVLVEQSIGHLAGAWSLRRWRACWFGCATSTGPQPRSSAWPAGSTVSHHEEHHGHPQSGAIRLSRLPADPIRPEEDTRFLPRRDAADRRRC